MSELHQLMALAEPTWILHRDAEGAPWRRDPLIGWGLLVDQADGGDPMRYVVGLVIDRTGASVTPAPVGTLMTQRDFDALGRCVCARPAVRDLEPTWCTVCGRELAP